MKYCAAALLLLTSCIRRTETHADVESTQKGTATSHTDTTDKDKLRIRSSDILRQGPIDTTTETTVETFTPDGGLARKVVRSVHRLAAPASEVKEASTAEDDTRQAQRTAELNEVRERLAKTETEQSSKPAVGIGLGIKIGLLLAALAVVALAVFRKVLAAQFSWLAWLVKK